MMFIKSLGFSFRFCWMIRRFRKAFGYPKIESKIARQIAFPWFRRVKYKVKNNIVPTWSGKYNQKRLRDIFFPNVQIGSPLYGERNTHSNPPSVHGNNNPYPPDRQPLIQIADLGNDFFPNHFTGA